MIACVAFVSCNKSELKTNDFNDSEALIQQFIDSEFVGNDFLDKPESYYGVQVNIEDNNGKPIIQNYYFSRKEDYIEFGDANNINLRGQFQFEDRVHKYLEEFPELLEIENPDELPKHYIDFEKNLQNEIFGKSIQERGTSLIFKECNKESTAVIPTTLPVMWPGWNNETSMNFGIYLGAALSLYDRSWYRDRMITYVWYGGYDCWAGRFYDNRLSSVIQL